MARKRDCEIVTCLGFWSNESVNGVIDSSINCLKDAKLFVRGLRYRPSSPYNFKDSCCTRPDNAHMSTESGH